MCQGRSFFFISLLQREKVDFAEQKTDEVFFVCQSLGLQAVRVRRFLVAWYSLRFYFLPLGMTENNPSVTASRATSLYTKEASINSEFRIPNY